MVNILELNLSHLDVGCLTGPRHQGAELHGFLSYLIKCIVKGNHYNIYGYKGKQVRDNIHSYDLVNMFWHYFQNPGYGEVYNAGGGRENSISILETISIVNKILNKKWDKYTFINEERKGDHKWYITNFNKFQKKFKSWKLKYTNLDIIDQIIRSNLINAKKNISIITIHKGQIENLIKTLNSIDNQKVKNFKNYVISPFIPKTELKKFKKIQKIYYW